MKKIAETERLLIRFFCEDDFISLYKIMNNPEVMYAWEHSFDENQTKEWLKHQFNRYKNDGYGYFAVILKETGILIGQCGLIKTNLNGNEVVEIGYIFDNSVWNNGYCREATKACIEFAFNHLNIEKLYATIRPNNFSSIKVAEKLGMKEIGQYTKTYTNKNMLHLIFLLEK